MSTIDSKNNGKPAPEALQGKGERKSAKKAKPAKKTGRAKKAAAKAKGTAPTRRRK